MTAFHTISRSSRKIVHSLTRVLIGLFILLHALLAFSNVVSLSHDPLNAATHSHDLASADEDQIDHGHGHEEFDDDNRMHQHGHSAADHSHDKPNVLPTHLAPTLQFSNKWVADDRRLVYPSPCFDLERPPKGLSIV